MRYTAALVGKDISRRRPRIGQTALIRPPRPLRIIWCVPIINYGPYQFPEKLIPLIILNALDGKSLPVYGDGRNIRDWLYVRDHCEAIWTIMRSGKKGETYNVGGDSEMENLTIVEMICDIIDEIIPASAGHSRRKLVTFVKDRPGHDRRYAIDFNKLHETLNWAPQESFTTGLRKTIVWYLENTTWIDRVRSGEYRAWISEHYKQEGSAV
jgi:dTDP-glucose 4,6-dehydratase